jgi:hypothetical protein
MQCLHDEHFAHPATHIEATPNTNLTLLPSVQTRLKIPRREYPFLSFPMLGMERGPDFYSNKDITL